jgi:hypothetical protein
MSAPPRAGVTPAESCEPPVTPATVTVGTAIDVEDDQGRDRAERRPRPDYDRDDHDEGHSNVPNEVSPRHHAVVLHPLAPRGCRSSAHAQRGFEFGLVVEWVLDAGDLVGRFVALAGDKDDVAAA